MRQKNKETKTFPQGYRDDTYPFSQDEFKWEQHGRNANCRHDKSRYDQQLNIKRWLPLEMYHNLPNRIVSAYDRETDIPGNGIVDEVPFGKTLGDETVWERCFAYEGPVHCRNWINLQ